VVSGPRPYPVVASGSPCFSESSAFRLSADVYLDVRHPDFVWFERLGLIRAEGAEVLILPGVIQVILALAGLHPVECEGARG
jgi:hypothetical protein